MSLQFGHIKILTQKRAKERQNSSFFLLVSNAKMHDFPMPKRMPVVFIGHGSPMNAIRDNAFTRALAHLGVELPRPEAILVISAHWRTRGSWVTRVAQPEMIYDFSGFDKKLSAIRYRAPGSLTIADEIIATVKQPIVRADTVWGFDHGSWAILKFLYPKADIPVLQLSFDLRMGGEHHYRIGEQLRPLRDKGILIVGSGNIVHNLGKIEWQDDAKPYDWAIEFDSWVKEKLIARDDVALYTQYDATPAGKLSVPSPDHYHPLLYVLGAAEKGEKIRFPYEGIENGSISMRAVVFESRS